MGGGLEGKVLPCAFIYTNYLHLKLQIVSPKKLNASGMVNNEQVYRGILDCLAKTCREGGIRGLYRGVGMTLNHLISFVSYITLALVMQHSSFCSWQQLQLLLEYSHMRD